MLKRFLTPSRTPPLEELIDLIVCPNAVEHTVTENGGKHTITFDRFISDALIQKISEFNAKKQASQKQIEISDAGLELIEFISILAKVRLRISGCNVYGIDANEANIAHHRDRTMVGMNLDNILCTEPSYDVVPACVHEMETALKRFMHLEKDHTFESIACMKVDVANDPRKLRSLDVEIAEVFDNIYCALPGKMTESAFLADELVKEILVKNDFMRVNKRPIDLMRRYV